VFLKAVGGHEDGPDGGVIETLYASCITTIDTIILTNYTNDAYIFDTYTYMGRRMGLMEQNKNVKVCITIIDTIIHNYTD
jgi:hypothetical protein